MKFVSRFLAVTAVSFALLACGDDTLSTEQEHHLEPVAIALENHETEEILAILYDESAVQDSVSQNQIAIAVGDSLKLHTIALCLDENTLVECELHDHDHEGEEAESEEEEAKFSLQATISDSSVAAIQVNSEEFEILILGKAQGQTILDIEIWHGTHTDITGKEFQIKVEQ